MRLSGDVEGLLDRLKQAYSPKGEQTTEVEKHKAVAKSITVKGDALIASEVNIETVQTRVTNVEQAAAIDPLQAANIASKAEGLAREGVSVDDILSWLAGKFGVPGYLSIPASGYESALTYLESKAAEGIRQEVNLRELG